MATQLSRYFEQQRVARGLKPGQLAQLLGFSNLSKNGSRIRVFEQTGAISKELFEKLVDYFAVDSQTIEELVEQDRREFFSQWLAWANEPVQPYLVVRLVAAIYSRRELSPDVKTIEEAEGWAASIARESKLKCCLVWNRRLSIWFNESGEISVRSEAVPGEPNTPWMGRTDKKYLLDEDLSSRCPVAWPKNPTPGS